jgi:hypothetical protein
MKKKKKMSAPLTPACYIIIIIIMMLKEISIAHPKHNPHIYIPLVPKKK